MTALAHLWRATPDLVRVSLAGVVAYRAEMVIWILSTMLPLIMLAVWDTVAAEGPLEGFGAPEFARYFAVNLLVRQLSSVWLVWELNYEIRTGKLSTRLLRPIHPLLPWAIDMLAALPLRVLILCPLLAALLVWRPELWATPSIAQVALFGASMALAWLVNFLVQALFAILSFWFDKTDGLFGLWFASWGLLSGYLAPIGLFPSALQPVLKALPFYGMLGLPVEILGGFLSPLEALPWVGVQLLWVVVLLAAVRAGWALGIRRYGAFGA